MASVSFLWANSIHSSSVSRVATRLMRTAAVHQILPVSRAMSILRSTRSLAAAHRYSCAVRSAMPSFLRANRLTDEKPSCRYSLRIFMSRR